MRRGVALIHAALIIAFIITLIIAANRQIIAAAASPLNPAQPLFRWIIQPIGNDSTITITTA